MRDSTLTIPWFADHSYVIGLFVAACFILHLLLIRLFPLSSIGWKKVDYIWLIMAFIGIFGSVSKNHAEISKNLYAFDLPHADFDYTEIVNQVDFSINSGAYCRTFVQGPYSPSPNEMAKLQHEYDGQCAWFKKFGAALKLQPKNSYLPIDLIQMAGNPPAGGGSQAYDYIRYSISRYNDDVADLNTLKKNQQYNDFDELIQFLGPIFLAIALALRMTKVTGEIRIERAKEKRVAYPNLTEESR